MFRFVRLRPPTTPRSGLPAPSTPTISKVQQKAIQKADTLIEALGWIRKFRDTTTVIKLGGSVVEHPDSLRHLLLDIVFMSTLGMRIVVVHGGGKAISRAMEQAGIEPRFVQVRRYADQATLDLLEKALTSELNHDLTAKIEKYGGRAVSLNFLSTSVAAMGDRRTEMGIRSREIVAKFSCENFARQALFAARAAR